MNINVADLTSLSSYNKKDTSLQHLVGSQLGFARARDKLKFIIHLIMVYDYILCKYLVKTGNCEPITLKRANSSAIVIKNNTHKRFFVFDDHVPDGNIKLFPLTTQRKQCTMLRTEIFVLVMECVCVNLLVGCEKSIEFQKG